jgi:hypothetical protein
MEPLVPRVRNLVTCEFFLGSRCVLYKETTNMRLLTTTLLLSTLAFADSVTDWNGIMKTTVSAQGAHHQARYAAIVHLAMFDAVNSISGEYEPYLKRYPAAANASAEAAAVAAAHRVLKTYFPASATTLDAARTESLGSLADGPNAIAAGLAVGEAAAAAMIAQRANDGAMIPKPYTPMTGAGYWQPIPPTFTPAVGANWGGVTPFAMESGGQFRPEPPPSLASSAYARDYREVKKMGDIYSTARTEQRTNMARYIALTSPTQLWNSVAVQLSTENGLSLSENARGFALMNMAIADASIAVFDAKYVYNFWRPVMAVRQGDIDGNPRTQADAAYTTFLTAPAYPSYPSGWGGLSNAARLVLEELFGKGHHSIELPANPSLPDMNLQFGKLRQLTDAVADARVDAGIHFRFEQDEAETQGERVARFLLRRQLLPACSGQCQAK